MLDNLLARQHLPGMAHQEVEQRELLGAQGNGPPPAPHTVARHVEHEVGHVQLALPARFGRATRQRAHAGQQLGEREGLTQVIVGPGIEAADAILHLIAGREHEHGGAEAGRAQAPADLQPIQVGQTEVQKDQIVAPAQRRRQARLALRRDIHHMPVSLQGAPQQPTEPLLILHHQDVHGPTPYRLSL